MAIRVPSATYIPNAPDQLLIYLLHWPAPLVKYDAQANLIEDTDALAALEDLRQALAKLLRRTGYAGNILACPGQYMLEVCIDPTKLGYIDGSETYIESLIQKWKSSCDALELNAQNPQPKSAAELGVRDDELKVFEVLAKARSAVDFIAISQPDRDFRANLNSPSIDAIQALPKTRKMQQGIDGQVTGLGVGDEGGTRLEVNRKLMVLVPGISIVEAFSHVQARRHLRGTMAKDEINVMERWEFHEGEPGVGVTEDIWRDSVTTM